MEIEIGILNEGFIGYKGTNHEKWSGIKYQETAGNDKDWSGLYIAEAEETAEGYLSDMVDETGNGTAYIHSVYLLEKIKLITCLYESFKTG